MPPRYARGRSPPTSPRSQAVGTQGGKKSLQARFFAAAPPAASALAGFPAAPSRSKKQDFILHKRHRPSIPDNVFSPQQHKYYPDNHALTFGNISSHFECL